MTTAHQSNNVKGRIAQYMRELLTNACKLLPQERHRESAQSPPPQADVTLDLYTLATLTRSVHLVPTVVLMAAEGNVWILVMTLLRRKVFSALLLR